MTWFGVVLAVLAILAGVVLVAVVWGHYDYERRVQKAWLVRRDQAVDELIEEIGKVQAEVGGSDRTGVIQAAIARLEARREAKKWTGS